MRVDPGKRPVLGEMSTVDVYRGSEEAKMLSVETSRTRDA